MRPQRELNILFPPAWSHPASKAPNPPRQTQKPAPLLVFVIALLAGFLIGFLAHDHIVRFRTEKPVWKSAPLVKELQ